MAKEVTQITPPAAEVLGEFNKLTPQDKEIIIQQLVVSEHFQGPLPAPKHLRQYDEIVSGAAERIITMAEKEQSHRHSYEDFDLKVVNNQIVTGQWMAFILTLIFAGIAVWLILSGFEVVGSVIFGTTIIGIATVFIVGNKKPKDDNK